MHSKGFEHINKEKKTRGWDGSSLVLFLGSEDGKGKGGHKEEYTGKRRRKKGVDLDISHHWDMGEEYAKMEEGAGRMGTKWTLIFSEMNKEGWDTQIMV